MKVHDFIYTAIDIANNHKTLYVMGCFGAPLTLSAKSRYETNVPYNRQASRTAKINAASADTFGFDCICLIKGILWGWNGNESAVYGGAKYAANGVPDVDADQMMKYCTEVSTDFSSIIPGEVVHLPGHIGIYIGEGLVVECTPAWKDGVQITSCANIKTIPGYNSRAWYNHGKLKFVEYSKEDKPMDLKDGLNEITYEGIRFNVVKGYGDYKQGYVMSAPGTPAGTALQTIDKFDSSEMMVLSIVNLDYFEMSDKSVYGMHYGAEYSVGDGVHSQGLQVPAYNPQLLTFYQKKDGTCGWCRGNNAPKNDILFACSPYSIRYHQGREINEISTCFQNKELISTKQTGICMLPDGTWIQIVSIDNTIPQTVSNLMKSIGAYEGFIVDGGGSTQMIYIGKKIVYTGRALPNVFVLACFKADMKASVKDEDISVEENNASQVELDDALKKNRELLKENTDLKLKVSNLEMKISKAMEVLK